MLREINRNRSFSGGPESEAIRDMLREINRIMNAVIPGTLDFNGCWGNEDLEKYPNT
jgi:hypothetical protein